jgi:hypothetical protein
MHFLKPEVEVVRMPKLVLIIALICNAFSFCAESLAGSFKESVSAPRAIFQNNSSQIIAARPINFGDRQPGNAAAHYSKAFDLLKYLESKKLNKEIYEVMQNGWLHEYTEIKKIGNLLSLNQKI